MASERENLTSASPDTHPLRGTMGVRNPTSWCEVGGRRIAIEEISNGDGQPVVCLHDAGGGSREFRPLVQRRPIGTRLIFFDWPGHGRFESNFGSTDSETSVENSAQALHAILNQVGIARPILVGSGYGAAVAIRYAADHPTRVLGLVLCQPEGLIIPVSLRRFNLRKAFAARRSASGNIRAAAGQVLRLAALMRHMQPVLQAADKSVRLSSSNLREALSSLSCPVLFALSRDSRRYPLRRYLDMLDPLLARAPQHRFTVFTGDFHPLWDEPARLTQALTTFLQAQLPLAKHSHAWLLTAVDWPTANTNLWKCVHPECPEERVLPAGANANEVR
jgi:pimeloyl-ACP methyl ester carboxylesterase